MSLRKALLAATVLALPVAAQAQTVTGLYIGAGLGANWLDDTSDTISPNGVPLATDVEFATGGVALASVGWGFGNGLRIEGEFAFRQNDADKVSVGGFFGTGSGGTVQQYSGMFNVLYDFRLGPVMPYIGAGIGYGYSNWQNVTIRNTNAAGVGQRLLIDDSDGQFAYQAILGMAVPLGVPGLALTVEGRYYGALSGSLDGRLQNIAPNTGAQTVGRGSYEADVANWSALLGIRYNFGQSAPPPPPAPVVAPAPARTFLVFFDWDRADLTDRARQIIGEAAQARTRQQVTRIEVNGHTDTSGSRTYNQGLSVRRANAVAAELVRLGVPRNEIVARGFGQTQLMVPTADNVREPQNRRVEIILR